VFILVCGFAIGNADFIEIFGAWLGHGIQNVFLGDWAWVRIVLTCSGITLTWYAAIALHELGHLVAGLLMGFRWVYAQVGHIRIDSSCHISRVSPRKNRLGEVQFNPEQMKNRPLRYGLMTLAGPVSNLLFGAAALALPIEKPLVLGIFIMQCIYMGIWNLLPWCSDGRALLRILFKRRHHEARIAVALLYQQKSAGAEIEQLSPGLIAEAAILREKSNLTVLANVLAFTAAYEKKDYAAAASALEVCLAFSSWASEGMRQALVCNAAILEAKRGHIDCAERWAAEIPPQTRHISRLKAYGAVLEARGDTSGTLQKIAECEEELMREPYTKRREAHLRRLREWKAEVEQRLVATPG